MSHRTIARGILGVLLLLLTQAHAQTDPLPSWNDGPTKQAIVDFVRATTDNASPKFVPPEAINLIIGRRPYAAFGNSSGDQQMLEWTQAGEGARLMMLVHHDDAAREYAYGDASRIDTFPDALMAEAKKRGWTVISMKKDWKRIFSFE